MCLAIPGKIESIDKNDEFNTIAKVRFGGALKDVNLAFTPEAKIGDYVVVHVGFSLSIIDEEEAKKVFEYLEEIDEIALNEGMIENVEEPGLKQDSQ